MKVIFIVLAAVLAVAMAGTIIGLGVALGKERNKSHGDYTPEPEPEPVLPACSDVSTYELTRSRAVAPLEALALLGTDAVKGSDGSFTWTHLLTGEEGIPALKMKNIGLKNQEVAFADIDPTTFLEFKDLQTKFGRYHQTTASVRELNTITNSKCTGGSSWIEQTLEKLVTDRAKLIDHLTKDWSKEQVNTFYNNLANKQIYFACTSDNDYMDEFSRINILFNNWSNTVMYIMKDDIETRVGSSSATIRNEALNDLTAIRSRTVDFENHVKTIATMCNSDFKEVNTRPIFDWVQEQRDRVSP